MLKHRTCFNTDTCTDNLDFSFLSHHCVAVTNSRFMKHLRKNCLLIYALLTVNFLANLKKTSFPPLLPIQLNLHSDVHFFIVFISKIFYVTNIKAIHDGKFFRSLPTQFIQGNKQYFPVHDKKNACLVLTGGRNKICQ